MSGELVVGWSPDAILVGTMRLAGTKDEANMRQALVGAAMMMTMMLGAAAARGAVLLDTFGPGDAFNGTGGQNVSLFVNVGVRFTPATAVSPTDITVAMKSTAGATITLSVCVDANGHPGTALASTSVVVAAGDPQVYHATFAAPTALTASTLYWIRAVPSSGIAVWMPNSTGATGFSFTSTSGAWNSSANGATPAIRVEDNSTPATGACCAGSTCSVVVVGGCSGANTRFAGAGVACNAVGATTPCCKADFNQSGAVSVQDIFDFLAAWFGGSAMADINGGGLAVQDIFDFLTAWFGGC